MTAAPSPPPPPPNVEKAEGPRRVGLAPVFPAGGRDRSIPISPSNLRKLLLGDPSLSPNDRDRFRLLDRLLGAILHYEFYGWTNELKDLYAPLSPDHPPSEMPEELGVGAVCRDEAFIAALEQILIRANYQKLEFQHLEQAVSARSELGLDYVPNFDLFDHLHVYVRGRQQITRTIRSALTMFRKRKVIFDAYTRVVVMLKFKAGAVQDEYVRSNVVYLRLFKDVPFVDMDMHLPEQGTRVRMRWVDRALIASPLMTGLPTLALKIASFSILAGVSPFALASALAIPVGAGLKSFFGFRQARQKHLHRMIRHLYYLTQANNSSVITRLIDYAEEEDYKEAVLAYFVLWRHRDDPEPWDTPRLDAAVEDLLKTKAGIETDFEIGDALAKLIRFGIVHRDAGDQISCVPIEQALAILDGQWDDYFRVGAAPIV